MERICHPESTAVVPLEAIGVNRKLPLPGISIAAPDCHDEAMDPYGYRDIDSVRARNFARVVDDVGAGPLSELLEKQPSQISRWKNGKVPISSGSARQIEKALGLQRGWLDSVFREPFPRVSIPGPSGQTSLITSGAEPVQESPSDGASQPERLTVATVVNTTEAVRIVLGRRGIEYDPIEHASIFVAALKEAMRLPDRPSMQESIAFASVVTELVNAQVGAKR
jgi:hypothetical protein